MKNIFRTGKLDSQLQDYIFRNMQYPMTNTGSQILDPIFRLNVNGVKLKPVEVHIIVSLN